MARATGPLLSISASGSLAHALTFAHLGGKGIAKRIPQRKTPRTQHARAARTRHAFLQQAWKADIVLNNLDPDWHPLASERSISPYNAFVGFNLDRTKSEAGPIPSPTNIFPGDPGTYDTPTHTVSGNTLTITLNGGTPGVDWGIWFSLLQNPLQGWQPWNIASYIDALATGIIGAACKPILNLPHGSTWYPAWRSFSFDGTLSPPALSIAPIHIP